MRLFRKTKYSTVQRPPGKTPSEGDPWVKCKSCESIVYKSKLQENGLVCPSCDFHYPLPAWQRIEQLTDEGSFEEIDGHLCSVDALQFAGGAFYGEKLASSRKKSQLTDAIVCGTGTLEKKPLALGVMDFRFMGASMGSVVGEKVTRLAELATEKCITLVIAAASGGARMQEGMLSLMQMAKTSAALARHFEAGLPYIVVLTHPTTAGVTASYASLGDVIVAEPRALVGFAGPRVIKQTTQSELPPGFQSSEFLQQHGFIDRVIHRRDLRDELALLLEYFSGCCHCAAEA